MERGASGRERLVVAPEPYRVPSMAEVAAARGANGMRVVSTFSGCGGSCLGFELAGFSVVYASEFVEEARRTYEANRPGVFVDHRDIRSVRPEEILEAAGLRPGEVDVLEGSPPCASFSTAGKRAKGWGQVRAYSNTEQRSDDLFFEFARILSGVRPRAFVAENVSGLVKGVSKGYFKEILRALRGTGYRVEARLLDASWLGVPQTRQRVIFVGLRDDLGLDPAFPSPWPFRYSIADACPWLSAPGLPHQVTPDPVECELRPVSPQVAKKWATLRPGESHDRNFSLVRCNPHRPAPTIQASHGQPGVYQTMPPFEPRQFTILELKRLCSFPDDFVLTGEFKDRWERLGRAVPPLMMRAVAAVVADLLAMGPYGNA